MESIVFSFMVISILSVVFFIAFPIIVVIMINNLKQRVKYLEKKLLNAADNINEESVKHEVKTVETAKSEEKALAENWLNTAQNGNERPRLKKIQTLPRADSEFGVLTGKFAKWIGENIIAKIAVIILFFGISFLLKYGIEHNMLSPEIRVLGSLILGFALFGIGWRFRNLKKTYSLILQGGGIGVLYLTIFAAFKIYAFIPAAATFILLIIICALSIYFALLQNAASLAVLAFVGAYLSPVLLSSGKGEHIILFSCYTIISLALVIISRWRSWRVLNSIGFAFTIIIASLWYTKSYKVEFYPETQAFIIANLLIFGILAVLLFIRQEKQSNAIDTLFLFGTPILSYVLEYHILPPLEFGAAFAALAFGLFYIAGSFAVLKIFKDAGKKAAFYMLGIGIGFATLAVPLAFDNDVASLIWFFEGSVIAWTALKNNQYKLGYFGLLITLFGVVLLIYQREYIIGFDAYILMNTALLFNACLFYGFRKLHYSLNTTSYILLSFTAVLWTYWLIKAANYYDGDRYLFFVFAFALLSWFWYFAKWEILKYILTALWPALFFMVLHGRNETNSLFLDISYLSAFAGGYFCLYKDLFSKEFYKNTEQVLHISLFWAVLLWIYDKLELFSDTFISAYYREYLDWSLFGAAFSVVVLVVLIFQKRDLFPFGRFLSVYRYIGLAPVIFYLVMKLLTAFCIGHYGYIPILNPLEESIIFTLIALKFYTDKTVQNRAQKVLFFAYSFFALICFLEINGVILRALSYFLNIPWSFYYLWNSETAQSALSIMWTFLALALIIFANRNKKRDIWFVGMALLVIVTAKLVLHDSVRLEGLFRAFVFIGVALLMLVIGFLAPMPPKEDAKDKV